MIIFNITSISGKIFLHANALHVHSKSIANALHVQKTPQKAKNPIFESVENQTYNASA